VKEIFAVNLIKLYLPSDMTSGFVNRNSNLRSLKYLLHITAGAVPQFESFYFRCFQPFLCSFVLFLHMVWFSKCDELFVFLVERQLVYFP